MKIKDNTANFTLSKFHKFIRHTRNQSITGCMGLDVGLDGCSGVRISTLRFSSAFCNISIKASLHVQAVRVLIYCARKYHYHVPWM